MEVTVNRQILAAALIKAFSITPGRTNREILKSVLVTAQKGALQIEATDEEISLSIQIEADVTQTGACLMSAKLLAICREADSENLCLSLSEDGKVQLSSGLGSWTLQTEDPKEFPKFRKFEGEGMEISSKALVKAIDRTIYATDQNSTRYTLAGINMKSRAAGRITLAGTDGRRLSVHDIEVSESDLMEDRPCIPAKAWKSIIAITEGQETITYRKNQHSVEFRSGDSVLQARILEGRFPQYEDVIPESHSFSCPLLAGPLRSAFRQAMIVTTEETRGVGLKFSDGVLKIQSTGQGIGQSCVEVPVESTQKFECSLDPKLVLDFLKTLGDEVQIALEATDADSAVVMTADGTLYIVMPLSSE